MSHCTSCKLVWLYHVSFCGLCLPLHLEVNQNLENFVSAKLYPKATDSLERNKPSSKAEWRNKIIITL